MGPYTLRRAAPEPSALLLPLQFSHCFRVAGQKPDGIELPRANRTQMPVLFERELDIRLRWEFSFWRNRGCRLRDAEDVRALGCLDAIADPRSGACAFPRPIFFNYDMNISFDYKSDYSI